MAVNFGYLVISLLKSLQLHDGGGLFDAFCAYLLARIVIFCHCLMNLCHDVCKRSARFILSCLKSKSKAVRSVASFSVLFGRQWHESIIGSNAIFFCCSQFNWNFSDFSCRPLIPVIKFCVIIICMMLMTVIGVDECHFTG